MTTTVESTSDLEASPIWRPAPVLRAAPVPMRALPEPGFPAGLLVTMRPYLLFVSGSRVGGLALVPGLNGSAGGGLGLVFFFATASAGPDHCFQVDTDSISAPYRPLVRGAITRRDVLWVSLLDFWAQPLCSRCVTGAPCRWQDWEWRSGTYTWFKRRWWEVHSTTPGSWRCSAARLPERGGRRADGASWSSRLGWTLVAVFFGYANFVLTGYYKTSRRTARLATHAACRVRPPHIRLGQ